MSDKVWKDIAQAKINNLRKKLKEMRIEAKAADIIVESYQNIVKELKKQLCEHEWEEIGDGLVGCKHCTATEKPFGLFNNKCLHCNMFGIIDGDVEVYDPCIGKLEGVTNACCGHGHENCAYVQFKPADQIDNQEALDYIKDNKK